MIEQIESFPGVFGTLVIIAGALILGLVLHASVFAALKHATSRTTSTLDDSLIRHTRAPSRVLFPALALEFALPYAKVEPGTGEAISHLTSIIVTTAMAWTLVRASRMFEEIAQERFPLEAADNLRARQVHTQIRIIRRIVVTCVELIAVAIILMTFPRIRQLGTSLLASAGVAGLVAGMAARPALANLIAGIQIALTQPIRIDDVVIVEGEWGWIEEIRPTFVVVRIWDLRRLVLPLTHFIEKPFQNWTYKDAAILGTIFIYTDYTVPVEEIRLALDRILADAPEWDGKVKSVQVTGATDRTVEIRALVSALDSGRAWDLRCRVREKLIAYLQEHHPDSLPRVRAELTQAPASLTRN